MKFEFLTAYRRSAATDIEHLLLELLTKVLDDNLNDFEPDSVRNMIQFTHERAGDEFVDNGGAASRHMLLGFVLELPEETAQLQTVIEEFASALGDTAPIFHGLKFEDPALRVELAQRAEEIFALEMKLRRVLSIIYLHANQERDPYDLLGDESVQPSAKEKPAREQMKAAAENQFFHLIFSQYVELNRRPELKLPAVLQVIRQSETYDSFREEVNRLPVEQEDDAVLLAGLRERMDAIERMRNCVAHNRRPTRGIVENYENARPLLDQLLDDYLTRWERIAEPLIAAEGAPEAPADAQPGEVPVGIAPVPKIETVPGAAPQADDDVPPPGQVDPLQEE